MSIAIASSSRDWPSSDAALRQFSATGEHDELMGLQQAPSRASQIRVRDGASSREAGDRRVNGNLTPFLEQSAVYNAFNGQLNTDIAPNTTIMAVAIKTLWCPSDGQIERLNYLDFSSACGSPTFCSFCPVHGGRLTPTLESANMPA